MTTDFPFTGEEIALCAGQWIASRTNQKCVVLGKPGLHRDKRLYTGRVA